MKKRVTFLLCISVLLSVAVLPVFAQEKGLVPCGLIGQAFCDTCDIFVLVKTVLDKLWNPFAIVIAAAMILYGGFLMLLPSLGGGSAAMHTRGVKVLTNALIGLTIVFFAWIAVDTILKVVAGGVNNLADTSPAVIFSSEFGPWNEIQCKAAPARLPIALLQIPEELRCPADTKSKIVGVFDVCDSVVVEAFVNDKSIKGAARGQCSASNIATLNNNHGSMIDSIAGSDAKLMRAIILIESGGSPGAVSPKGACGIAQVLPSTARKTCNELKDARTGITEGLRVVRELKATTGGDIRRILIGYNGGNRALETSRDCPGKVKGECEINPGGYVETINYFKKVEQCFTSL